MKGIIKSEMEEKFSKAQNILFTDVCSIIEHGREQAYNAVSQQMLETYWNIGRRIVEEEQHGKERAGYGERIIDGLSEQLTLHYGKGFGPRYLRAFRKFYQIAGDYQIWKSRFPNLTWTHVFKALRVDDANAIRWYLDAASHEMWSVRTLDRKYDEMKRTEGDNPTIGIVLCSETSKDIARYSILNGNEQLFAAKYKTYMPTEEQLCTEIERQKQLFYLQQAESKEDSK